jgi:hypothetical protein
MRNSEFTEDGRFSLASVLNGRQTFWGDRKSGRKTGIPGGEMADTDGLTVEQLQPAKRKV